MKIFLGTKKFHCLLVSDFPGMATNPYPRIQQILTMTSFTGGTPLLSPLKSNRNDQESGVTSNQLAN